MAAYVSSHRKCLSSPDSYCFVCGSFTIPNQRANISAFVTQAYLACFKVKLGDKPWASQKVCKQHVENLQMWTKRTQQDKLSFGIPMGTHTYGFAEPKDHCTDCNVCLVKETTRKTDVKWSILVYNPVSHSSEIPDSKY